MTTVLTTGTVGVALLSSTGSVLSAISSGSVGLGAGSLTGPDTSGTATVSGYQAGAANTTGWITAFGYQALMSNTTGGTTDEFSNTAVGINALRMNVSGLANTAIGGAALYNNLGGANVAIGSMALEQNTIGQWNTAVGVTALLYLETANGNTAVGYKALTSDSGATIPGGSYNTAVGFEAGRYITSGSYNTLFGDSAGQQITSGAGNDIFGDYTAGNNIVTGSYNTAVGSIAGPTVDISYTTCLGRATSCAAAGGVAIGVDHTGAGAAATTTDQFVLGTSNHAVAIPGTLSVGGHLTGVRATVQELELTTTGSTSVLAWTPPASGNFHVGVYFRVDTATTTVTVVVEWEDVTGSRSYYWANTVSEPTGAYPFPDIMINNVSSDTINVLAQAGTANQVYVSASIVQG